MKKHINIVGNIVGHWRSHQDELLAIWLLRIYGSDVFPGVEHSKIVFLDKDLRQTYDDDIYVGLGGMLEKYRGVVFDEHRENGRIEGTCAAMMVAEHLKLGHMSRLAPLLSEALWCDVNPGVKETRLASIIKVMHRVKQGDDQFGTYRYAAAAFNAIVDGAKDSSFDLRQFWKAFAADRKIDLNSEIYRKINRYVNESFSRRNEHTTELAYIACRMDRSIVKSWLGDTFGVWVKDCESFLKHVDMLKQSNPLIDVQFENGIEPALMMQSDNELANKAVNSAYGGKPAVLVVQRSSGNIQVFADPERGIDLTDMGAMVRMAEYKIRTGKCFTFESARGEGTNRRCRVWHQPNQNTLLNGSLSHPWVSASRLTLEEIQDIVEHAFTETGRKLWFDRYFGRNSGEEKVLAVSCLEDMLAQAEYKQAS